MWQCCGLSVVFEGGLQYVDIELKEKDRFGDTPGEFPLVYCLKSDFWGVGPQLGFDLNYCVCNGLSIVGNINGALVVGESCADYQQEDMGSSGFKNETLWRIVPAAEIQVGLDYQFCWCWDWAIGVGYEFYSYVRALDNPVLFNNTELLGAGVTLPIVDTYTSASLHGPYVSITASF